MSNTINMKKFIGISLVTIFLLGLVGCAGAKKHHGYTSKYPCHAKHPCEH